MAILCAQKSVLKNTKGKRITSMKTSLQTKKGVTTGSSVGKVKWIPGTKLKYKKIELAPTDDTEKYQWYIDHLLEKVFRIKGALTTDESSIYDFDFELVGKDGIKHNTKDVLAKIKKLYGVDVSKVKGLNLVGVVKKILLGQKKLRKAQGK
jgi:hypothetical protein